MSTHQYSANISAAGTRNQGSTPQMTSSMPMMASRHRKKSDIKSGTS